MIGDPVSEEGDGVFIEFIAAKGGHAGESVGRRETAEKDGVIDVAGDDEFVGGGGGWVSPECW